LRESATAKPTASDIACKAPISALSISTIAMPPRPVRLRRGRRQSSTALRRAHTARPRCRAPVYTCSARQPGSI
jgi:hypothetical protein